MVIVTKEFPFKANAMDVRDPDTLASFLTLPVKPGVWKLLLCVVADIGDFQVDSEFHLTRVSLQGLDFQGRHGQHLPWKQQVS